MVGVRRANNVRFDGSGHGSLPKEIIIEEWISQKDKFRVVASGLPMVHPLRTERCDRKLEETFEATGQPLVDQVLDKHGIPHTVMHLERWYQPHDESGGKDTLVILTRDTNTESWHAAAKDVLSLLRENGLGDPAGNIQVEIRNPNEMYDDCSMVLPDDKRLVEELTQIEGKVFDIVEELMHGTWFSIAYHLRVNRRTQDTAAGKPTVVVFCYPGSSCTFEVAEERIIEVLNGVTCHIYLEFLPGNVTLLKDDPGKPMYLHDHSDKCVNGSSMSVEGNTTRAGSLGGWMFLNLPEKGRQIQCAVTSYDVVRPSDQTISDHTDKHGVSLHDAHGPVAAEFSAAYDLNYTLKMLNQVPEGHPAASRCAKRRENLLSLDPRVGSVVLASGHRVKDHRRLDWALVESPSTFSPNKPPPKSSFTGPHKLPLLIASYTQNADSKVRHIGRVEEGGWVTKVGRTTGITSGEINRMRRKIYWQEHDRTTSEIEIMSEDGNFAQAGDSGSMVLNVHGELVGLIFAADKYPRVFETAFMTPIDLIQEDVKHMSGGGYLSLG